ncbi:MAG: hypothetical protein HRU76_01010 [Phycisphaeraceae bacterium]|nr:MAG: hypothetical protein HRU76_01010 [Phycisphaeraceae bacterium]
MATRLETADDFAATLAEVELLLRESDEAAPGGPREDERRAAVLNKAALLLMTGKFEAFLETAAEDFLFAVNQVGGATRFIPPRMLAEHSVKAVAGIDLKLSGGDIAGVSAIFAGLAKMWGNVDPCSDLAIACKFNYGKHGESEVIKLFKRFGIDDVFAQVPVVDDATERYEGQAPPLVDVKGMVNSLTGIRNNILHQDESPSLTSDGLRKQIATLHKFAVELVKALQSIVDQIDTRVQAEGAANAR